MGRAEDIADAWTGNEDDLGDLPENVAEAVQSVKAACEDLEERVAMAEALWEEQPQHPLALEPGEHNQITTAYRYEEVDGEILEIRKENGDTPTEIIYRPELRPPTKVDPLSALEARLAAPEVTPSETEAEAEE